MGLFDKILGKKCSDDKTEPIDKTTFISYMDYYPKPNILIVNADKNNLVMEGTMAFSMVGQPSANILEDTECNLRLNIDEKPNVKVGQDLISKSQYINELKILERELYSFPFY